MKEDANYQEAVTEAYGRGLADMFRGMVDSGMSRQEALEILKVWVAEAVRMQLNPKA